MKTGGRVVYGVTSVPSMHTAWDSVASTVKKNKRHLQLHSHGNTDWGTMFYNQLCPFLVSYQAVIFHLRAEFLTSLFSFYMSYFQHEQNSLIAVHHIILDLFPFNIQCITKWSKLLILSFKFFCMFPNLKILSLMSKSLQ